MVYLICMLGKRWLVVVGGFVFIALVAGFFFFRPGSDIRTPARKGNQVKVLNQGKLETQVAGPAIGGVVSTNDASFWEAGGVVEAVSGNTINVAFGQNCVSNVASLIYARKEGTICGGAIFQVPNEAKVVYFPATRVSDNQIATFVGPGALSKIEVGDYIAVDASYQVFEKGSGAVRFISIVQ